MLSHQMTNAPATTPKVNLVPFVTQLFCVNDLLLVTHRSLLWNLLPLALHFVLLPCVFVIAINIAPFSQTTITRINALPRLPAGITAMLTPMPRPNQWLLCPHACSHLPFPSCSVTTGCVLCPDKHVIVRCQSALGYEVTIGDFWRNRLFFDASLDSPNMEINNHFSLDAYGNPVIVRMLARDTECLKTNRAMAESDLVRRSQLQTRRMVAKFDQLETQWLLSVCTTQAANMILDHVWELFGQLANETVETINRESIRMDAPPHLWMYPALLDEFDHNAFDGVHAAIADTLPPDSDDDS